MKEVFSCEIGQGTICNLQPSPEMSPNTRPVEIKIKEQIQDSAVMYFDETETKVNGKGLWLQVSSTETHTHYQVA